jgi:hypothetical protein
MNTFRRLLLNSLHWRKSSWSAFHGNCVEVAPIGDCWVGVRDTKDNGSGPVLVFGSHDWRAFLNNVKRDDLDLAS